jgi:hypothetical protein
MIHGYPPGNYLLSSSNISKINRIKFFQEFKEETPLFEKAKPVLGPACHCNIARHSPRAQSGMIKIAHNMALKIIPNLFLPVCLVSGFRCQVPAHLFIIPDT